MLTEQEKFNTVVKNFQYLIDTNRIVKKGGLRVSHTVLLRELFEMFEERHPGELKKAEYFKIIRRIPTLSIEGGGIGPKITTYTLTDLEERKVWCAQTVAQHFDEMVETGRIEKRDSVRASHTLLLADLFRMYDDEYPTLMRKTEYFAGVRKIERLSIAGSSILGYVNTASVPTKKEKANKTVEVESASGQCEDCEMKITTAGSGANHAKATGHTVNVQTVLNTTFNPKA